MSQHTPGNVYEANAQKIAQAIGLVVKATFKGDRCPPWEDKSCKSCVHGDRYCVTLKRVGPDRVFSHGEPGPRSLSFDFWNSQADMQAGKQPRYYDILACVASNASTPTDPDEVAQEYGDLLPTQAIAIAKFAKRLQAFFAEAELEMLREIR